MAKIRLGVIVPLTENPEEEIEKVHQLGLPTCQISLWRSELVRREIAQSLIKATGDYGVEVTTVWTGWPGPAIWNLIDGPRTLGLVPPEYRKERIEALKRGSDFAEMIGAPSITTHVGFIPEWPGDPLYPGVLEAVGEVALYCKEKGQYFNFETGQETPITLLRAIEDLNTGNLGINLDPANLLLYGKGNPIDSLDIFGKYVRGVHAKDGEYPTNGRELGREKPLGQGKVNFPALVGKLKGLGYTGALTIEREIKGNQQIADIKLAKRLLEPLCE
ncbi:MAG: sugar phosphate isomerase/epimerase family protein [bacterium]